MENKMRLLLAGGDLRQLYAAVELSKVPSIHVSGVGFSQAKIKTTVEQVSEKAPFPKTDVLLLPISASNDDIWVSAPYAFSPLALKDLLSCVKPGGLVCGGQLSATVCRMCQEQKLDFCDYFQREELCFSNAVPTAEGAIQIAMEEMNRTICGSHVLIIGYGRIGKVLAARLQGLQANVTIAARSCISRAYCEASGLRWIPLQEISETAQQYDWICNTVPASVCNQKELAAMRPDVLLMDLASKPGGIDFEAAKKLQLHVIWALALPGKVAPITAGEIIAKTIFNILEERGLAHATNDW